MNDYFLKLFCALQADRRGVTALEYAILAGVLGTLIVTAAGTFGGSLSKALTTVASAIPGSS